MGTPVPVEEGHDSVKEMTRCVIEEYLSMGWTENLIMGMFKKPVYRGPHTIYRQKGEEYVQQLITESKQRHDALMQRILGDRVQEEV